MSSDVHRRLRELLGVYALGQLAEPQVPALRAHLDGCHWCRSELDTIIPAARALRGLDAERLADQPAPPPELGEAVLATIAAERRPVQCAARRRKLLPIAGIALLALAGTGVGFVLGRTVEPEQPKVPLEPVAVRQHTAGITASAQLVAHTWGVEIELTGRGFHSGSRYRVTVTDSSGQDINAGEFLGTGETQIRCSLNSAVLRHHATGFRVADPAGATVLTSSFQSGG